LKDESYEVVLSCGAIYYVVPENIQTHPMDGHWKFRGGEGSQKPVKFLTESTKLHVNWDFWRGGGVFQTIGMDGCGYIPGSTH